MNKWNLIIDVSKCSNCNNCTMAVKDEYVGNEFPGYSAPQRKQGQDWITIDRHVRGNGSMVDVAYVPKTCNHCDNAPCVQAGKDAVTKRDDGIVIIDPVKAKGRKDLVASCPYGSISWNEELQLPQAWTFDAHLLDAGWKETRGSQVCGIGAMRTVKLDDAAMAALAREQKLQVLKPELNTKPRVYYRGLEQVTHCFLGGNVAARDKDGRVDNVEGASVELSMGDGTPPRQATTDVYGDFKIDGLLGMGEHFRLRIRHAKLGSAETSGTLETSRYLGTLELA
jgi:Fe-S-cluster-containing dehydrogenase component